MTVNQLPLPNGLKLVNTGLSIGDRTGDTLRVFAEKFNDNQQLILTENDDLAGLGLDWNKTTRKLNLLVPDRHLIIGSSLTPFNIQEFIVSSSGFSIRTIPASKISGNLSSSTLRLTTGKTLVGDSNGRATEIDLGPEFRVSDGNIEIFNLPWSRIVNPAIPATALTLSNNRIPVGTSTGRAAAIELGPDFVLANNRLSIARGGVLVNLVNINAAGPSPGKFLGISGTSTSPYLEWKPLTFDTLNVVPSANTVGIRQIRTRNKASSLAQLTVTEDGNALHWYPSVDEISEQREYIRYLNNQQRRLNLDYARSIAELQNQDCIIFNTDIPSIYSCNIFDPVTPQFIPGFMYIAGGLSENGYNKSIETIQFSTEAVKVIEFRGAAIGVSTGDSVEGLIKTKLNPMSVSSPSDMYIQGTGSTTGQEPFTTDLERLNYTTQVVSQNSTQLSSTHRGGPTLFNYKKGYFMGGLNQLSTTYLLNVTILDYLANTVTNDSSAFTNPVFGAVGVTQNYNQGFIFGGRQASGVFSTILRYVLATNTTVNTSATLGTLTPHRSQSAALDNEVSAFLFNGAKGLATGPEENPALDPRIDQVSKFSFLSETIVRLALLTSGTLRSSQTASGSLLRGFVVGGLQRVKQEIDINVWQESLTQFANRVRVDPTAQNITGFPEVSNSINGAQTDTTNVDYTNTDTFGIKPPNLVVTVDDDDDLNVDVVAPNKPNSKPRFNS
jgi:hypothetical protein